MRKSSASTSDVYIGPSTRSRLRREALKINMPKNDEKSGPVEKPVDFNKKIAGTEDIDSIESESKKVTVTVKKKRRKRLSYQKNRNVR